MYEKYFKYQLEKIYCFTIILILSFRQQKGFILKIISIFEVNDTNIKWYDLENFNEESQYSFDAPNSLDFVFGSDDIDIVYEVMSRQNDVTLSESLEVLTNIRNRTYLYASIYLIFLETEIIEKMVEKLASLEPLPIKFVFRDSAFKDNISLKDETFRKLRSLIERNSVDSKVSYRVEFIQRRNNNGK